MSFILEKQYPCQTTYFPHDIICIAIVCCNPYAPCTCESFSLGAEKPGPFMKGSGLLSQPPYAYSPPNTSTSWRDNLPRCPRKRNQTHNLSPNEHHIIARFICNL